MTGGWMDMLRGYVTGNPQPAESIPAPNPSPRTDDDPQLPNQGDAPLTPGGTQGPGEPGGPLTPDHRPDEASTTPGQRDRPGGEPMPESESVLPRFGAEMMVDRYLALFAAIVSRRSER